jgi:chromosome segregation ATPase
LQSYSSTSTLLQEISALRLRLRDLEDDTRSSVVSSSAGAEIDNKETEFITMMRKEIAQLQQEKATMEKEFLNQLSSLAEEKNKQVADLRKKVATGESLNAELNKKLRESQQRVEELKREADGEVDEAVRLLDQQRVEHAEELEQLKKNLAAADLEIADSRGEIDAMHEQLFEVQTQREALLEEVAAVKLQLDTEQRTAKSLKGELNKQKLVTEQLQAEIKEKDVLLERKCSDLNKKIATLTKELETKRARTRITVDTDLAEKKKLETDVSRLEGRLSSLQDELKGKEQEIHKLSASLKEERRENKKLKVDEQSKSAAKDLARDDDGKTNSARAELSFIRNQNKILKEEVKALKRNKEDAGGDAKTGTPRSDSAERSAKSIPTTPRSVSKLKASAAPPPSLVPSPAISRRKVSAGKGNASPGTPVSGLVATFERRIASSKGMAVEVDGELAEEAEQGSQSRVSMPGRPNENDAVALSDLQEQLSRERETVAELRSKLSKVSELSPAAIAAAKQRGNQEEVDAKLKEFQEDRKKRKEEVARLRSELVSTGVQRDDFEKRLRKDEREIERLKSELAYATRTAERAAFMEEKKEEDTIAELELLRGRVKMLEANEATVARLRSRTVSLESELEAAVLQIQELEAQLGNAKGSLEVSSKIQKDFGDEVNRLTAELGNSKARFADLEVEYNNKITALQKNINSLKEKAQVELQEKQRLQKEFLAEASRLASELEDARSDQNALERDSSLQAKEFEKRIEALETEKERLKQALESSESKVAASVPQKEYDRQINQLTVELTKSQMKQADQEREYSDKIQNLENELEALETEAEKELQSRQSLIDNLKKTLELKEKENERLEDEKAQICSSMNDASFSRKDELEELQAELIDMSTKTKSQAREIQSLKMKLEDYESRRGESNTKLRQRIKELEEEVDEFQRAARNQVDKDTVAKLRSENVHLRECLKDVKMEKRSLAEKLDSLTTGRNSSKSSQVLRDRNAALKQEVEKLTKRLKKMEDSITRFAI